MLAHAAAGSIILGLIWTLILRYEIKRGRTDDDAGAGDDLLKWVQSKIPGPSLARRPHARVLTRGRCAEYNIQGWTKGPSCPRLAPTWPADSRARQTGTTAAQSAPSVTLCVLARSRCVAWPQSAQRDATPCPQGHRQLDPANALDNATRGIDAAERIVRRAAPCVSLPPHLSRPYLRAWTSCSTRTRWCTPRLTSWPL
jgi:hypothetical protein